MSFFANIRVRLPDYLDKIVRNDATGGVLMLFCTVLALVLQNGSYSTSYRHWLEMQAGVIFGDFQLIKPLLLWINDGLITIFFFSIGLELKIEFIKGHLSELRNVVMPCLGAIAGIVVPSLFFIAFNYDNAYAMRGWAIPTSTDTAFSLAIILLLGSRVPISLRVFLLSMAIFDDIGAILVIALFYTSELSAPALVSASFAIMCLLALNYFGVARKMFYLFFGVILWFSIFKSGMHATLAGIITAFCIPMKSASGEIMVERIYESLKMWVALLVLPVFTIANAGVDLSMIDLEGFLSPVSLGIFTGLFFGKQLGIFATIWLCIKLKLVQAPADANYRQIYGVCILTGIGFSMSMFIDSLAYQGSSIFEYADSLAILVASLCSGVFGYCFLRFYACRTLEIEYRPWLPAPGGYKGTASTATTYVPTEGASSVAPTAVAVAEANARAAAAAKAAQAAEEAAAAAAAAADAAKKVAEDDTQSVAQVQLAAAQAAAAAATAAVSSTKLDTDPDQDTNEVAAAALEAATAAADIAAEVAEAVEAEAAEAEAAEAEAEAEEAESESEGETAEAGTEESAAANEAEPSPDEQSSSEPAESETQASAADTTSESQAEAPAGEGASASAEATETAVVSEVAEPAQGVATTEETVGEVTPLSVDSIKPEETADEVVPVESTETAESETKQPEAELDLALHADAVKAALEAEASGENPQQAAAAAVAASKEQETTEAQSEATTSVEAEAVTAAAATTATAATAAESAPVEEAKADKADKSEKAEKSDKTEKTEKAEAAEKTKEEKKAAKAKKADKAKEKEEKSGNDDDDFAAEYFKNVVKLAQAEVLEPHHHKAETKAQASFSSDPDASLTDAAQTAQDQVVSEETSAVAEAEAVAHAGNAAGTATDAAVDGAQAEQSPDSAGTANAEATEAQVQPDLDLALNAEAVAAAIAADEAKAQAEAEAAAVQAEAEAEVTTAEQGADMVNFAISQEDAQEISTEVSRQVASVGENMETVDTVPARNKDIADTNFNQDFVQLNTESVTVNYSMEHASDKATEVQPEVSVQQPEPIVPEALAEEPVVVADTSATTSAAPAESSAVPAESSAEPVEAVAAEAAEAESVAPAQDQSQVEAQPEVTPQEETQTEPEAKVEAEASEAEAAADAEAKTESSTWQKLTSVLKKHKD